MSKAQYLSKMNSISLVIQYLSQNEFENLGNLLLLKTKIEAINKNTTEEQLKAYYQEYCTLIKDGAIQRSGFSLLWHVCYDSGQGGLAIISDLMEAGVNPNKREVGGAQPLAVGVEFSQGTRAVEIAKLLMANGADPHFGGGDQRGSAFLAAIKHADMEPLEYFISMKVDLNKVDNKGNTALHLAVKEGKHEAAAILLCAGVNVNQQNAKGETALHLIPKQEHWCDNEHDNLLVLLLKYKANPNLADTRGYTPLFHFIGMPDRVKLLIEAGADVNHQEKEGNTPRSLAARETVSRKVRQSSLLMEKVIAEGSIVFQQVFIDRWSDVNRSIRTIESFHFIYKEIAKYLQRENLKLLDQKSRKGVDLNTASDEELIQFATAIRDVVNEPFSNKEGYHSLLEYTVMSPGSVLYFVEGLLNIKRSISIEDQALLSKDRTAYGSIVELFFQFGMKHDVPDQYGRTPLFYAAKYAKVPHIEDLVKRGAVVNPQKEEAPLFLTTARGSLRATQCLVNAKANVNLRNSLGETPLFIAAEHGTSTLVEYLFSQGADKTVLSDHDESVLFKAAKNYFSDVTELLIKNDLQVNVVNSSLETPLHIACAHGHVTNARLLLQAGANPNAEDKFKNAPLHYAIQRCHYEVVALLVSRGAKVTEDNRLMAKNDQKLSLLLPAPVPHVPSGFGMNFLRSHRTVTPFPSDTGQSSSRPSGGK